MLDKKHCLIISAEEAINDKRFNMAFHEIGLFYQFLGIMEYVLESDLKDSRKVEMINEVKNALRTALEIINNSDLEFWGK